MEDLFVVAGLNARINERKPGKFKDTVWHSSKPSLHNNEAMAVFYALGEMSAAHPSMSSRVRTLC